MAQVSDDFSDGDFVSEPVWVGDSGVFEIDATNRLHLNSPEAGESHLVTSNTLFNKVVWEFFVRLDFNPSGSNRAKVYLMSDRADLENALNGYYVMIGDTDDEVSLYRQEGTTSTYVINGADGVVASTPAVSIKVQRDQNGTWALFHDTSGGGDFILEGTASDHDSDIVSTAYFGFWCDYTITRADRFYFDNVSIDQLRIDTVAVISDTVLQVTFNQYLGKTEAEAIGHYTLSGLTIANATRHAADTTKVTLTLDSHTPLTTGDFTLEVDSSLTLNTPDREDFSYRALAIAQVRSWSDKVVVLDFNDDLDTVSAISTAHYSIEPLIGNPISARVDDADRSVVILMLGTGLSEGTDYQLDILGVKNEAGNSSLTTTTQFDLVVPLRVDSAAVVSENTIRVSFNKSLNDSIAEIPSHYLLDQGMDSPLHARLQADGRSVLLTFGDSLSENSYMLTVDHLEDVDGNAIDPGSTVSFSYLPLAVVSVTQLDEGRIEVKFNQPVAEISAERAAHYEIPGVGNPQAVRMSDTIPAVTLTFYGLLNSRYQLEINGVRNESGNSAATSLLSEFEFDQATAFRSVVVNEIMADFSPSAGQPEGEYVELYNPRDTDLRIGGFLLNGEPLPEYTLEDSGYVLVTDDSDTASFPEMAHIVALSSFDVLTNAGDSVVLRDQFGNLVDSVFYRADWYRDDRKGDGGYSLEQINPGAPCSDNTNWKASESVTGGTPGAVNAVYSGVPDEAAPSILSVEVITGDTLLLTFSEPVDESAWSVADVVLEGYPITESVRTSYRTFYLLLNRELAPEEDYTLKLSGIADCSGNVLTEDTMAFYYDVRAPQLQKLIVVSSNSIALTFHEPLKRSVAEQEENYRLDRGIGVPGRAILQDTARHRVHLEFETPFHENTDYRLLFEHLCDTLNNALSVQRRRFTFQDDVDSVHVIAPNLLALKLKRAPSVSTAGDLSRFLVDSEVGNPMGAVPVGVAIDESDSSLLRLAFENNFDDNRKLRLYIEGLRSKASGDALMTPASSFIYDTRAPAVEEALILNDSQLVVVFDEPVQVPLALSSVLYTLEPGINPVNVESAAANRILLTFAVPWETEQENILSLSEIPDLYGNAFGIRKVRFTYDPMPPAVQSVRQLSDTSLRLVVSEKLDVRTAGEIAHYRLSGGTFPDSVAIPGPDSLHLLLYFGSVIPPDTRQRITIQGLSDRAENRIAKETFTFNSKHPSVARVVAVSDTTLEITFSKEMSASAGDTASYRVYGNRVTHVMKLTDHTYRLRLADLMTNQDTVQIRFESISDRNGGGLQQESVSCFFQTFFRKWRWVEAKTLELEFTTGFRSVSAAGFSLAGQPARMAFPDGDEKNIIRVLFEDRPQENQALLLSWSGLSDLYRRRVPDHTVSVIKDTRPPEVVAIDSHFSGNITVTFNEPLSAASFATNHFAVYGRGFPEKMEKLSGSRLRLDFDAALADGKSYLLMLSGIADLTGNFLPADTLSFTYQAPPLAGPGEVIINELMVDPAPSAGRWPETEYLELWNAGSRTFDLAGLKLSDRNTSVALPELALAPGGYAVLTGTGSDPFSGLEKVIKVPGFPSLDNRGDSLTLTNLQGAVIDRVVYNDGWYGDFKKGNGGYSLELINPSGKCPGSVNWAASVSEAGGTPGARNSVYSTAPDGERPRIRSYSLLAGDCLQITFSEPMDSASLVNGRYSGEGLAVDTVTIAPANFEQVLVSFQEPVQPGALHQLRVSGLADCSGNFMVDTALTFGLGELPATHELLITEIMADPEPSRGLPVTEYLELFNASDRLLSLGGVSVRDATSSTTLPGVEISPGEYVILTPSSSASSLMHRGKVMAVSPWPALTNAGERLVLSSGGQNIFQVSYSELWHEGDEQRSGGYALEMKDPANPCGGRLNWGSSTHPDGGTPGTKNAIASSVLDHFGPELKKAVVMAPSFLRLVFDERLMPGVEEAVEVRTEPETGIDTISRDPDCLNCLFVQLKNELVPNEVFRLIVEKVTDCSGNPVRKNMATFVLPELADSLDVLISEVLFNPRADGVDFVELYNHSKKYIDLKGWKLARMSEGTLEQQSTISSSEWVMAPGAYLALTPNPDRLLIDYPDGNRERILGMEVFPVYTNESGTVVLTDGGENVVDQFSYHEDFHLPLLESVEGVSLERISFEAPAQDPNNWRSAASTARFATPGYANSQSFEASQVHGTLTVEPKVFVPGSAGSWAMPGFTTINYQFGRGGQFANVMIYNQSGQLVKSLAEGALLAASGFFRWDGTDGQGRAVRLGYYLIVFEVYDGSGRRDVMKETVVVGR